LLSPELHKLIYTDIIADVVEGLMCSHEL